MNSAKDRCRLTFNERKEENGAVEWTNRSVSSIDKESDGQLSVFQVDVMMEELDEKLKLTAE